MFSVCKRVDVNVIHDCVNSPTTISVEGISSYVCPTYVDKYNWLTVGEDHSSDAFEINQDGDSITVTRTDGGGSLWCMGLSFACCQGVFSYLNVKR